MMFRSVSGVLGTMKYKLAELIEYLGVPAFVFTTDNREIVTGNAMIIRSYGLCFLKHSNFKIPGNVFPAEESFYLRIVRKEPELTVEVCPEAKAQFHVIMFTEHLGLAYESLNTNFSAATKNKKRCSEAAPQYSENFHISYIYNIGTGKWAFSQPETLRKMGLIDTDIPDHQFDLRSIIHEEDLPLYDSTIANAIQHGGNHEIHYRVRNLKGENIPVADYCGITIPEKQWPILIGSIIVNRKADDAMLRAERQVLTGRLLGGMIHDFKNLLGGIRNMIEWSINISHDHQVCETLRKTLDYTDQATELICGTLRLNNDKNDSNKIEKISLDKIILDLENLITRILPTSTKLELSVAPDVPFIYGRKVVLQDMILNLCVNARDAMKLKGNLLTVSLEKKELADEHGLVQPYLALTVKDNGCGMSKNEVKQMFDIFYSTKETGFGLGLWMVKNAIQAFDGRIEVDSKVGEGTAIRVLFPVIKPNFLELPPEEPVPVRQEEPIVDYRTILKDNKKTILYIEDNLLVSSSVSNWLESFGFHVLFADNGLTGKNIFEKQHQEIDLVIQDFVLPGMKGDELLDFFCHTCPDIPVIIVSAENDEECTHRLLENGAADMIRKPFKIGDLLKSVTRVLHAAEEVAHN